MNDITVLSRRISRFLPLLLLQVACGDDPHQSETCLPAPGTICTIVGTGVATFTSDGLPGVETSLYYPMGMAQGPDGQMYFVDWNNHRIRVLTHEGIVQTVAGSGRIGEAREGPALASGLNHPSRITFDPQGRMVIAAWHNSRVLRLDLVTGWLEHIAGTGRRDYAGNGGPARDAVMDLPSSVVFDAAGDLLIMDQANQVIRRVDADGIIETIAGQCIVNECADEEEPEACPGPSGKIACDEEDPPPYSERCRFYCRLAFAGDGEPASSMRMAQPYGVEAVPSGGMVMDAQGNLYFADTGNRRIRRIDASGVVTTIAGNGTDGFAGDGGPAVEAALSYPTGVDLDSAGTLYIADTHSSCVRAVSPDGVITTVVGVCGERGFEGDGGDPAAALLDRPYSIAVDRDDNLYVSDTYNHRIRVVMR